jgi:hypothetical protein
VEYVNLSGVVVQYLLEKSTSGAKFSQLTKQLAANFAFKIVCRGYELTPPRVTPNVNLWGPKVVEYATSEEREVPSVIRQTAVKLLEKVLDHDSSLIRGLYITHAKSVEDGGTFCTC